MINDQMKKYLEEAMDLQLTETHPGTSRDVDFKKGLKKVTMECILDKLIQAKPIHWHYKIMLGALELACGDLEAGEVS